MIRIIKYVLTEEQMEILYNKYNNNEYDDIEQVSNFVYSEWLDELIGECYAD